MPGLIVAFGLQVAWSGTLVVTSGDPSEAAARVAETASLPASSFDAAQLQELLGAIDPVMEGGQFALCDSENHTVAELQTLQVQLQGDVNYVRLEEAAARLETLDGVLGCLSEAVDPALGARVSFLAGVIQSQRGIPDEADAAFRLALLFDPDLTWDPKLSPRLGKDRFDSVAARAVEGVEVRLLPPPPDLSMRIDGIAVAAGTEVLTLAPGRHLVQLEGDRIESGWLEVGGDPSTLVLPSVAAEPSWLDDPEGRTLIAAVLAVIHEPGTHVYLVGQDIWFGELGGNAWHQVLPPAPPPPVGVRVLTFGGAAVGVLGGVGAAATWFYGRSLRNGCTEATAPARYDICEDGFADHQTAGNVWPATLVVAGAGAALGLTGGVLGRLLVTPTPLPGGAGLGVTWVQGGRR